MITETNLTKNALHLINEEYKKDITIDISQVLTLPLIIEKYLKIHFDLMLEINKLELKRQETFTERYIYYKEGYKILLAPNEIKNYLEGDKELLETKENLIYHESLFKQISDIIAELKSLQFILKMKLDYEKMINGC